MKTARILSMVASATCLFFLFMTWLYIGENNGGDAGYYLMMAAFAALPAVALLGFGLYRLCPYCAESISIRAHVCPHCQHSMASTAP